MCFWDNALGSSSVGQLKLDILIVSSFFTLLQSLIKALVYHYANFISFKYKKNHCTRFISNWILSFPKLSQNCLLREVLHNCKIIDNHSFTRWPGSNFIQNFFYLTISSLFPKPIINLSSAVKIKKTLKNLTVTETQDAIFSIELTHPNVDGIQWIRNGVALQSSDKYDISVKGTVYSLRIKNCSVVDESVYGFKLGRLGASARLHVESKFYFLETLRSSQLIVTINFARSLNCFNFPH